MKSDVRTAVNVVRDATHVPRRRYRDKFLFVLGIFALILLFPFILLMFMASMVFDKKQKDRPDNFDDYGYYE